MYYTHTFFFLATYDSASAAANQGQYTSQLDEESELGDKSQRGQRHKKEESDYEPTNTSEDDDEGDESKKEKYDKKLRAKKATSFKPRGAPVLEKPPPIPQNVLPMSFTVQPLVNNPNFHVTFENETQNGTETATQNGTVGEPEIVTQNEPENAEPDEVELATGVIVVPEISTAGK